MYKKIFICLLLILLVTGCNSIKQKENNNKESNNIEMISSMKIEINNQEYEINLEQNETVKELTKLLPLELTMNELNGNEKYANIDKSLPTNSFYPDRINKGDVYLFGNDCIVIFYESFVPDYSYTKIGHIDNLPDLGNGNIKVRFYR